jgi:hypothetical protein
MSGAEERSPGLQSGRHTAGNVTGAAGIQAGATSTSLRDQSVTRTESTTAYGRGPAPEASYPTAATAGTTGRAGLGGVITMLAGLLTFFAGLAAVVRSFNPTLPGYAYRLTLHTWGWILLVLGVLLFAAGASHLLGLTFSRVLGVGLAVLTAIAGFMFLVYTPIWGTILVALSVLAIWSMLGNDASQQGRAGPGMGTGGGTTTGVGSPRSM